MATAQHQAVTGEKPARTLRWPWIGVLAGAFLLTAPLWGLLGTILGVFGAFERIRRTEGTVASEELEPYMCFSRQTTILGGALGAVGAVILVVSSVILFRQQHPHRR